jgi:hypothetical protein
MAPPPSPATRAAGGRMPLALSAKALMSLDFSQPIVPKQPTSFSHAIRPPSIHNGVSPHLANARASRGGFVKASSSQNLHSGEIPARGCIFEVPPTLHRGGPTFRPEGSARGGTRSTRSCATREPRTAAILFHRAKQKKKKKKKRGGGKEKASSSFFCEHEAVFARAEYDMYVQNNPVTKNKNQTLRTGAENGNGSNPSPMSSLSDMSRPSCGCDPMQSTPIRNHSAHPERIVTTPQPNSPSSASTPRKEQRVC